VTVPSSGAPVARPQVHLLEFNASPDFHQSGTRLQTEIRSMFDGVVTGIVAPFFGVETVDEQDKGAGRENWSWEQGTERAGWKCFVKGEVRRGW
jgi:tubulin--tyrosine ligase